MVAGRMLASSQTGLLAAEALGSLSGGTTGGRHSHRQQADHKSEDLAAL